ncbi:MAG TPA: hypothetical protein VM344_05740 [Vitreimonas sp.]|nr:hypothetical protein [Vitreimonas sp.]
MKPSGSLSVMRLVPTADAVPAAPSNTTFVVVDTLWTPGATVRPRSSGGSATGLPPVPIAIRHVAEQVLCERDLIEETAARLDAWAEASGVVEAMSCDGTSYWYYIRLRHWMWLQQQLLWLAMLDRLVRDVSPDVLACAAGVGADVVGAARRIAERDGLPLQIEEPEAEAPAKVLQAPPVPSPPPAWPTIPQRLDALRLRITGRLRLQDVPSRRQFVMRRLRRLGRERGRLLVVLEHARQRVETPSGPRFLNPYLGPIVERLRGTRLEPIEIDIRAKLSDEAGWLRINEWRSERLLPADAIALSAAGTPIDGLSKDAAARADAIAAATVPLMVSGVDLGPALAGHVADEARRSLAGQFRGARSVQALLQQLRPAGILLADEYHRQTWLAAAGAEGVPTVAVQHGMIYRWHNGYMHRRRPTELRLADRTYVFGSWERELLLSDSVYEPDEVRIGGSPRLDLVRPDAVDRGPVREELGVAAADRMVVVSGTWGPIYRRFHYPIELARLFDRPLPNVHVVIKLHPGEKDEGPYRAVIEGMAASGGFEPPPITVIQAVDLYRLLAAADAHIGIHSTVLTEAVWTATPNLLAANLAGADLLGYVQAGVAHPVCDGADLLAALDGGMGAAAQDARRAFLDAHFEPGSASERIAGQLLEWL